MTTEKSVSDGKVEGKRCSDADFPLDTDFPLIELARLVYPTNDHRAALKRRINERLGSQIVEEESYAAAPRGSSAV
jgi:hypothetical protein